MATRETERERDDKDPQQQKTTPSAWMREKALTNGQVITAVDLGFRFPSISRIFVLHFGFPVVVGLSNPTTSRHISISPLKKETTYTFSCHIF